MKPSFNIDFNFGCGWYSGSKFQILAISLFDKIGDEIFCTFQVAKFVLSLSITLYQPQGRASLTPFRARLCHIRNYEKTIICYITIIRLRDNSKTGFALNRQYY